MQVALRGRRAVLFARTGAVEQSCLSMRRQLDDLRAFAERTQMVVVQEISQIGNCLSPVAAERIAQQAENGNVEVLVITSWDRLTRSGVMEVMSLREALRAAGVAAVALTDSTPHALPSQTTPQ